jgi:hypothetical protein
MIKLLFPDAPRTFPFRRGTRTGLRAAHVLASGTLLGGHIFGLPEDRLFAWMVATFLTGALLAATDLHASFAFLCEVRGSLVVLKLLCFAAVAFWWDGRALLLGTALAVGVVGSHMPGRFRHHLLWMRGRLAVDTRKG